MRDYMQSLLACLVEEVLELNLDNIATVFSTLRSIPDEDAYIIDQLDATSSGLVRARYPTLLSPTPNWVQSLVEVDITEYSVIWSSLDFPTLLASRSASAPYVKHMLNTRGYTWTPYYKGWLASCLVHDSYWLDNHDGHRWTMVVTITTYLAAHGTNITSSHPTMAGFWYIQSPVLLLLSSLVAGILSGDSIRGDDQQVLLNSIRELNLESQLVTICIHDGRALCFYGEVPPWVPPFRNSNYLVGFAATDLVEMLAAPLSKHAPNRPQAGWQRYHGAPRKNRSLLQSQCQACCRTIARDVAKVRFDSGVYPVALLCSSASMRSQILDTMFQPCRDNDSIPAGQSLDFDGPVWEVPDADLTIPILKRRNQKFKRFPVDPYTEVSPHEWKQHCTIRDYYAREAQIQSLRWGHVRHGRSQRRSTRAITLSTHGETGDARFPPDRCEKPTDVLG